MISESLPGDQFFSFTALENLPASISLGLYISVTLPLLGHSIELESEKTYKKIECEGP